MIKIAFCDDDLNVLKELERLFACYCVERTDEMNYVSFQSPLELMAEIEKGVHFDIIFLDVIMPGQNGMELAKEIRAQDEDVKIIFLTNSSEFAVQSYTVKAYFYQLKPIHASDFFSMMDQLVEQCNKSDVRKLVLKCKNGIMAIDLKKLEYCEVIGHNLLLHLNSGVVLERVGKLSDLEEKLKECGSFLKVHRSYLVNMEYIQHISYRAVKLACQIEIPIPHGKYQEIKVQYLNYAFEKESTIL